MKDLLCIAKICPLSSSIALWRQTRSVPSYTETSEAAPPLVRGCPHQWSLKKPSAIHHHKISINKCWQKTARHIMQDISRITSASGLISELDLQPLGERRASAKAMMIHEKMYRPPSQWRHHRTQHQLTKPLVFKAHKRDHKQTLLQALHWLLVQARTDYKLTTICHNSLFLSLWFSHCVHLFVPGCFVLVQTHGYFASSMLKLKLFANALSLTVLHGILSLLTSVTFNPPMLWRLR